MPIGPISIDSRTLAPGAFFVAIRGERFDGHRFVADVLSRGAVGALVDTQAAEFSGAGTGERVLIRAGDTTCALQDAARHVRRRAGCTVIAITGSAGKTTTK